MAADSTQNTGAGNEGNGASSGSPVAQGGEMSTRFLSLSVSLHSSPRILRERVESLLRSHGIPLRWAITSVDAARQIAQVEAVVTQEHEALDQPHQGQSAQGQGTR